MEVVQKMNTRMPVSAMLDPEDRAPRHRLGGPQTRSPGYDQEPRDVRGRGRGRADHGDLPARSGDGCQHLGFTFQIILWLWFTVLFANFAEAVAEGRGKARPSTVGKTRTESQAKLLSGSDKTYRLVSGTSPQGR